MQQVHRVQLGLQEVDVQGTKSSVQGYRGYLGAAGAQGVSGAANTNRGAQGPQGARSTVQGTQGNLGAQGGVGTDGTAGWKGVQGNKGIQGTAGVTSLSVTNTTATAYLLGGSGYSGSVSVRAYSQVYMNNGYIYTSSDIRLKDNIRGISQEFIDKVYNNDKDLVYDFKFKDNNSETTGFIAQYLEELDPNLIIFNKDNGYYGVNYNAALSKLVGVLLKKTKEQDRRLNEQENKINELETVIRKLLSIS